MNKLLDQDEQLGPSSPELASDYQSLPILKLEADEYRDDVAAFGMTKAQEDEFLQALWQIMCTFVDLGWGLDSVQMLLPELAEKTGQDSVNLLNKIGSQNQFNSVAQRDKQGSEQKGKSS